METTIPKDWGKDSLSEFIEEAHHNTLATFVNLKPEYEHLQNINEVFKKITENLLNIEKLLPGLFLLRSHASYLGAVRLAVSGQIPETFMVLRGCLETSLYALHLAAVPGTTEIWIQRSNDEASLRQCKNAFSIGNVFKTLQNENDKLFGIAKHMYETTIEYGGHPNEASLNSITSKSEDPSKINFKTAYLTSYIVNWPAFILCLKSTARIGICSLLIFDLIFPERFTILGLSDRVKKLSECL